MGLFTGKTVIVTGGGKATLQDGCLLYTSRCV